MEQNKCGTKKELGNKVGTNEEWIHNRLCDFTPAQQSALALANYIYWQIPEGGREGGMEVQLVFRMALIYQDGILWHAKVVSRPFLTRNILGTELEQRWNRTNVEQRRNWGTKLEQMMNAFTEPFRADVHRKQSWNKGGQNLVFQDCSGLSVEQKRNNVSQNGNAPGTKCE